MVRVAGKAVGAAVQITRGARGRSGRLALIAGVGAIAMAAAFAAAAQEGHGPGPGGPRSGEMMVFGGSPEHAARSVDRLLDGLNATEAQRLQIRQIAMGAANDLRAQRAADRSLADRGLQIFTAPTVDASAAEALRQQLGNQRDQASRRVLQAMLEVAKVLSPEQRAMIGQRFQQREAIMRDRMQRMQQRPGPPR